MIDLATEVLKHAGVELPVEFARAITSQVDPLQMVWMLASVLSMDVALEHDLLAVATRAEALRLIHAHLSHELQILEIRGKIATKAQNEMGKEQREYVLRQQLRAIQQELGGKEGESELELLRERLKAADLPDEVRKEAEREMSRLDRLSTQAPDYNVGRTWLELILELPWKQAQRIHHRYPGRPADPRRRPLRPERRQGAHPGAPGRAEAEPRRQSADPVLRRASGGRQNFTRPVDRPRAGPQVRAAESGRHA